MTVVQLLLLLSGDVESNPGPPKRMPRAPVKVEKKDEDIPPPPQVDYSEQFGALETKVTEVVNSPPKVKNAFKKPLASMLLKPFVLYASLKISLL